MMLIYLIIIKTGLFIKSCNDQTSQMKNSKKLNKIFHSISNESCKPLHLNCEIKHNLNVMVGSIDSKYYESPLIRSRYRAANYNYKYYNLIFAVFHL